MSESTGTISEYDAMDQLGWITADDGTRVRFGLPALHEFQRPTIGLRVRVIGTLPGFRGVPKAVRVVPEAYVAPDIGRWLEAMGLDPSHANGDWEMTHAVLVERFARLPRTSEANRLRVCAIPSRVDGYSIAAAFAESIGETITAGPDGDALEQLGERLRIREHGSATPCGSIPLLFVCAGRTGDVYLLRSRVEVEATPREVPLGLVCPPDTDSALDGLFREDGASPAYVDHATTCATCQKHLRENDPPSLPDGFRAALR
jgi:hypothetical protein